MVAAKLMAATLTPARTTKGAAPSWLQSDLWCEAGSDLPQDFRASPSLNHDWRFWAYQWPARASSSARNHRADQAGARPVAAVQGALLDPARSRICLRVGGPSTASEAVIDALRLAQETRRRSKANGLS
jgi:hypothetical protein